MKVKLSAAENHAGLDVRDLSKKLESSERIEEDKVALSRARAELVESLATPLSVEERVRVQGELSIINAKIKALNTTEAARLKAEADRRKAAGLAEARANAARAKANLNGGDTAEGADEDANEGDDPGQAAAIDAWIIAVLRRGGMKVRRARDGALDLIDAPAKWVAIFDALCAGIHAVARGEELPEVAAAKPKTPHRKMSHTDGGPR